MNVQFKDPSCSSLPVPTLIKSVCNYYRQEGNLRRAKKIGHGLGIFKVKLLEQNLLPEHKDASSGSTRRGRWRLKILMSKMWRWERAFTCCNLNVTSDPTMRIQEGEQGDWEGWEDRAFNKDCAMICCCISPACPHFLTSEQMFPRSIFNSLFMKRD